MELLGKKSENKPKLPDHPVKITDADFNKFISSYPLVVVDFWAEWCAPCRIIAPIVENLAKTYAGKVVFGKLNVDENPTTAVKYRISAIPTLVILKNGVEVERIVGVVPKNIIETTIKKYL
ncbi:thioredoxin [Candidatus Bathyarchaeota archaeon]|nr:MAG: thioredoxin [Candidatus Bathyarchaeota archaeon]